MRASRIAHRLISLGVVLGFLATSLHLHDDAHRSDGALHGGEAHADISESPPHFTAGTDPQLVPVMRPDDAHHEHSPTYAGSAEPCLGCRTRQEAEQALSADPSSLLRTDFAHHEGDTSPIPCDSTDRRLPGVRAPPPCRA